MQPATNSIAFEIRSTLSGIFNVMTMFETMPTSYMRAFIAVAKHEGKWSTTTLASAAVLMGL